MCADPTGSATRLSDEHKSKKKKWITGRIHCCFPVEPGLWEVELGCVGVRPDGGRGDLPAQVLLLLTSISLLLLLLTWTRLLITVYSLCFPSPVPKQNGGWKTKSKTTFNLHPKIIQSWFVTHVSTSMYRFVPQNREKRVMNQFLEEEKSFNYCAVIVPVESSQLPRWRTS